MNLMEPLNMSKEIKAVFPCTDWFFVFGPVGMPDVIRLAGWGQMEDGRLIGLLPGDSGERPVLQIPPVFVKGKYKHLDDLNEAERAQHNRALSR
jgi:hypothetical protein